MENASKALIIAGAILIAILIISFGVIILGQGSDVINNANMSEAEMSAFNGKFTAYEGSKVKGSNVRQLLRTVLQSNLSNEDNAKKVTVELWNSSMSSKTKDLITASSKSIDVSDITPATLYVVKCYYSNGGTGLVNKICVGPTT